MFSVDTEEDARDLLTLACETNRHGEFIARELVHDRTLASLALFSDRLAATWAFIETRRKIEQGRDRDQSQS